MGSRECRWRRHLMACMWSKNIRKHFILSVSRSKCKLRRTEPANATAVGLWPNHIFVCATRIANKLIIMWSIECLCTYFHLSLERVWQRVANLWPVARYATCSRNLCLCCNCWSVTIPEFTSPELWGVFACSELQRPLACSAAVRAKYKHHLRTDQVICDSNKE
jgi:hypothetical protein